MGSDTAPVLTHDQETRRPARAFGTIDFVLRFLLFGSSLAAVLVLVTSKEEKLIPVVIPGLPAPVSVLLPAKFTHSPAFIYLLAALSVVGLYSLITTIISFLTMVSRNMPTKVLAHLIIIDVLLLGILASATGAAGGVAYIGLKGNKHTNWLKICNQYHKFCRHVGSSIGVSIFASNLLLLLVLINVYALSKKIPK